MTRKSTVQPDPGTLSRGAFRGYPPRCDVCGFTWNGGTPSGGTS